jgi:hypothetical protein
MYTAQSLGLAMGVCTREKRYPRVGGRGDRAHGFSIRLDQSCLAAVEKPPADGGTLRGPRQADLDGSVRKAVVSAP